MEKWLQKAPELAELVADTADHRKKRSRLAVIIPSYNDNPLLKKQLEMLSRQTFRDFDIIAVYGKEDEFIDTPEWASMLHIKEKSRTGSAGAFYLGQKKALEDGYELITLADNDCLPISEDLLEKFSGAVDRGADVILPDIVYTPSEKFQKGYVIHHYGCIRDAVLRKSGFSFLPFYFGGEDFELSERIADNGFNICYVDSLVSHPKNRPALISSEKRKYYCGRGELEALFLNGKYLRAFTYMVFYLEMGIALILLGKGKLANEMFRSVKNASSMEFFKSSYEPLNDEIETSGSRNMNFDVILMEEDNHDAKHWLSLGKRKTTAKTLSSLFSQLMHSNRYFGKRILVSEKHDPADIIPLLMAKTAYIKFGGKYYSIYENRSIFSITCGLFLAALSLPFLTAASFPLTINAAFNKKIKNISSRQYGL